MVSIFIIFALYCERILLYCYSKTSRKDALSSLRHVPSLALAVLEQLLVKMSAGLAWKSELSIGQQAKKAYSYQDVRFCLYVTYCLLDSSREF